MAPLDLREFVERLRITGTNQEADFADELLELLDLREEVAEPFWKLCEDLDHYVPDKKGKPDHQLEWLGDQVAILDEIREELEKHELTGDPDDAVKEVLETLDTAEDTLRNRGHWKDGEFLDALFTLAERSPLQYDL